MNRLAAACGPPSRSSAARGPVGMPAGARADARSETSAGGEPHGG
jgi:hypothetical protein